MTTRDRAAGPSPALPFALGPGLGLALAVTLAAAAPAQDVAPRGQAPAAGTWVRAARIVVAPDSVLEQSGFLVRDGKVAQVGGVAPTGAAVEDLGAATVTPGCVDPHATLGLDEDLAETITTYTPDLRAADAFDPFAKALPRAARAGVTTVGLSPTSRNTFAGLAAAVKTGAERGTIIEDACYLKAALVREALDQERLPTSRMGAIDLMRAALRAANDPQSPAERVLREVRDGGRALVVHARTRGEIGSTLRLCEEFDLQQPILLGADEAEHFLERLRRRRASVILAPLSFTSKREALELPAKLERAGIPFSFSGTPETLRVAAALAVRHGVSRPAALAALTRVPAQQLGVTDRAGALRQGMDADFLVFDGDPTELKSRLQAVWIAGRRLPPAEETE